MEIYTLTKEELRDCIDKAKQMLKNRGTLNQMHQFAKSNIGKLIYYKLMFAKIDKDFRDDFSSRSFQLRDGSVVAVKTICNNDNRVYVNLKDRNISDRISYVVLDLHKEIVKNIIFGIQDYEISGYIGGTFVTNDLNLREVGKHIKDGKELTYIKINKERIQYEQTDEIDF